MISSLSLSVCVCSSGQAGSNFPHMHSNQYSCSGIEGKLDECQHSTGVDCGTGYAGVMCIQQSKGMEQSFL